MVAPTDAGRLCHSNTQTPCTSRRHAHPRARAWRLHARWREWHGWHEWRGWADLGAARTRHEMSDLVCRDETALVCVKELESLVQLDLRGGRQPTSAQSRRGKARSGGKGLVVVRAWCSSGAVQSCPTPTQPTHRRHHRCAVRHAPSDTARTLRPGCVRAVALCIQAAKTLHPSSHGAGPGLRLAAPHYALRTTHYALRTTHYALLQRPRTRPAGLHRGCLGWVR